MEDNRLNFNCPLLSVRRVTSKNPSHKDPKPKNESSLPKISPSPSYKSDYQSGPLRDAGTVPFVWEQSPGKPKHETKTNTQKQTKTLVPNLPPGRISKPKKQEKVTNFDRSNPTADNDDDGVMYMDAFDTLPQNEVKKVVNRENEKPRITYGPNFLQFIGDESEEDSDIEYNENENMSYRVCGLLPHFCLKGHFGLLNPVPGLSVRTRMPISSANKTHSDSSSSTSSQPARATIYEQKLLTKAEKDQSIIKNESTEEIKPKNIHKLEGSGIYDRLQTRGISESSPPLVSERKDSNLQTKPLISFKELLAVEKEKENDKGNFVISPNPTVEKTVYVDTIHKMDSRIKNQPDEGIFGISRVPTESLDSYLVDEKLKQDKEVKTEMRFRKVPEVSRKNGLELPAPPPLPKSPSDSWLWRTLPSVSSKTASLKSNFKYSTKVDKNVQLRNPKGLLLPIPET